MIAGVAVGVALFLLLLGAHHALGAREQRTAWMQFGAGDQGSVYVDESASVALDAVLARTGADLVDGRPITRIDLAGPAAGGAAVGGAEEAAGATSPAGPVPGIGPVPAVGTAWLSPALAELVEALPSDQLGDRLGTVAGTIGEEGLGSPDALVVVSGVDREALAASYDATIVSSFTGRAYGGNTNYQVVALVGSIAILFPVLLLVGIVTDLGAAQRRERSTTLRLIGATGRDTARIAAVETGATALVGALVGTGLARLLVPLAAQLRIEDGRLFGSDLVTSPLVGTVAVVVATAASVAVAVRRAGRADRGPLTTAREAAEPRPGAARLLVLGAGLAVLVAVTLSELAGLAVPQTDVLLVAGFVATSAGLVLAGPWATRLVSLAALRHVRSASGVVALSRIARTPRATFRSVSGLVIAVFMVSVFAVAASTAFVGGDPVAEVTAQDRSVVSVGVDAHRVGGVGAGDADAGAVEEDGAVGDGGEGRTGEAPPAVTTTLGQVRDAAAPVADVAGVQRVVVAGAPRDDVDGTLVFAADDAAALGIAVPAGSSGAPAVALTPSTAPGARWTDGVVEPVDAPVLESAVPSRVLVVTDGSAAAIERARTALELTDVPAYGFASTRAEQLGDPSRSTLASFAAMANVGMAIATLVASASLTVATVAGVLDRRRNFGLLRLVGMPVRTLRAIVVKEAAVPLLAVTLAAVVLGFVVAWTIVVGLTGGGRRVGWPDWSYVATLAAASVLAVGSVTATFGTVRRSTSVSSTRFE